MMSYSTPQMSQMPFLPNQVQNNGVATIAPLQVQGAVVSEVPLQEQNIPRPRA